MHKDNEKLGYTIVPNSVLWNKELRLEEKALLAILISNKEDWKIYLSEIAKRSLNGADSHRRAFHSLIKKGFASQHKYRDPITKQIKWMNIPFVNGDALEQHKPETEQPSIDNLGSESPAIESSGMEIPVVETTLINNTNVNNTKEEIINEKKITIPIIEEDITNIKSQTPNSLDGSANNSDSYEELIF
jgi:hypothetical protein